LQVTNHIQFTKDDYATLKNSATEAKQRIFQSTLNLLLFNNHDRNTNGRLGKF